MIKPKWDSKSVGEYERSLKPKVEDDDDIQEYKKPWVGLDFDTIEDCFGDGSGTDEHGNIILPSAQWLHDFAYALEAKLKEKNT